MDEESTPVNSNMVEFKMGTLKTNIFFLFISKVLAVLKNMPTISQKYLDVIINDKPLYEACDMEVKQQIWKDNQSLFGDQVGPIFTQYIRQKEKILFDYENVTNLFFSNSPKVRFKLNLLSNIVGYFLKLNLTCGVSCYDYPRRR